MTGTSADTEGDIVSWEWDWISITIEIGHSARTFFVRVGLRCAYEGGIMKVVRHESMYYK